MKCSQQVAEGGRWDGVSVRKEAICVLLHLRLHCYIFQRTHIQYHLCNLRKLRLCLEEEVSLLLLSLADFRWLVRMTKWQAWGQGSDRQSHWERPPGRVLVSKKSIPFLSVLWGHLELTASSDTASRLLNTANWAWTRQNGNTFLPTRAFPP